MSCFMPVYDGFDFSMIPTVIKPMPPPVPAANNKRNSKLNPERDILEVTLSILPDNPVRYLALIPLDIAKH